MRSPQACGLPRKFKEWRRGQERAARDLAFSDQRFNLICIPTGGGKTAVAMGYVGIEEDRAAYLTATRQLSDQVMDDFRSMGLKDIRGRLNYICDIDDSKDASQAVCTGGVYCALMKGGCTYYDKQRVARESRLVNTNYRYWLHAEESGGLGEFPILICDEAHRTPDEISDFAAVEVTEGEVRSFGLQPPPRAGRSKPGYWASQSLHTLEILASQQASVERRRSIKNMQRRLARLCRLSDEAWLASSPRGGIWRWDLIDPGALAEELLFRGAKKIILVSASIRRKTLQLLGVDDKVKVLEQDSAFPVTQRPIYYWPVARPGRSMSSFEKRAWLGANATIIEPRMDRNGVIHSVSFDRAWEIFNALPQHQKRMTIIHKRGEAAADVFEEFVERGKRRPTILISPSVGTGVDFKYQIAEYQIIPKVPFPDMSSPLVKARAKHDKEYIPYVTMQTLVQNAGRPVRADDDHGETFITDGNFGWLRGSHWDFAPRYFHAAVRTIDKDDTPPGPPPRLLTGGQRGGR